ncbi:MULTISPECIES: hypothetical protein [Cupriavidus]
MLVASLAQGEERPAGGAGFGWDPFEGEAAAQVSDSDTTVLVASLGGWGRPAITLPPGPPTSAYHDAPSPLPAYADAGPRAAWPAVSAHLDDATSATGHVGNRVQSMALSFDTVLPGSGGLTIQPRLQLAYQPAFDRGGAGFLGGQPADASAAEVMVRLYRTQPTRLNGANGIYPFVEADLWQDHKQAININGTRIDPDMLRGLLSVNVGAHGSTNGGVKLWIKLKAGRNPGGTLGARYRW